MRPPRVVWEPERRGRPLARAPEAMKGTLAMMLRTKSIRRVAAGTLAVAAAALLAVGCGSDDETDEANEDREAGDPIEAPDDMEVSLDVELDDKSGVNVRIETEGFEFAPEHVNDDHEQGEGHSHLYVNGKKVARPYQEYFYLPASYLEEGETEFEITLNGNDHGEYERDGEKLSDTVTLDIPAENAAAMAADGHSHSDEAMEEEMAGDAMPAMDHGDPVEAEGVSVDFEAEPDPTGGVNLEIMTEGFEFTPENVNGENEDGEGHAHLYIDGEKWGRLYGEWFHLTGLDEGEHEIMVTLNANDHSDLVDEDGEMIAATKTVEFAAPSDGHDHDHGDDGDAMEGQDGDDHSGMEMDEGDDSMMMEGDADQTFTLDIEGGEPAGGPVSFEASEGEMIAINVTTDEPVEIHVHGPDLYEDVDGEGTIMFEAPEPGSYEIETHGGDSVMLGTLTIT